MDSISSTQRFSGRTALVTGGSGFLGKALVAALLKEGATVKAVQRTFSSELASMGVEQLQADIASVIISQHPFFNGVTDVFHTAAKVEMWGKRSDFFRVNYTGTKNLLDAAQKSGVETFVFTSSPSVIANGKDLRGVDENHPYPRHFSAFLSRNESACRAVGPRAGNRGR